MMKHTFWTNVGLLMMICLATTIRGYGFGPPVERLPTVCQHMFPTGHHAAVSTEPVPFDINLNAECYAENVDINVAIRVSSGYTTYFEGLFIQARRPGEDSMSYGIFSTTGDQDLKTLDCFDKTANCLSQSQNAHYTCKNFTWRAPVGERDQLQFQATIVHEVEEFWTKVLSKSLTYDAECSPKSGMDLCVDDVRYGVAQSPGDSSSGSGRGGQQILIICMLVVIAVGRRIYSFE